LDTGHGPVTIPAPAVRVTDPCGAGDCFASAVVVRMMSGAETIDAVRAGVDSASRFLAAGGASGCTVLEGELTAARPWSWTRPRRPPA
jgi:sugar/nucleoside kinase (ribokinase family)